MCAEVVGLPNAAVATLATFGNAGGYLRASAQARETVLGEHLTPLAKQASWMAFRSGDSGSPVGWSSLIIAITASRLVGSLRPGVVRGADSALGATLDATRDSSSSRASRSSNSRSALRS